MRRRKKPTWFGSARTFLANLQLFDDHYNPNNALAVGPPEIARKLTATRGLQMSGPLRAAEVALLVIGAVIFAAAVDPATAKNEIAARKMLYPQREYSKWQTYPVRTVQDIQPKPKAVALDRYGGRRDKSYTASGFYYARKIQDRWWLIDPEGNPYLNAGVAAVAPARRRDALPLTPNVSRRPTCR